MARHATKTSYKSGKEHKYWNGGTSDYWRREARIKVNCPKGLIVHHKDGNFRNNKLDNLQIMTQSEHVGLHNKLRVGYKRKNTLMLNSLNKVLELKKKKLRHIDVAEKLNISRSTVKRCCIYLKKEGKL